MVLAELTGGIAERLEQFGDGRVFRLKSDSGAGHSDFGQAGAERVLAADEGCASGGAALLAVVVGEGDAFVGDAVDVRRPVAHHASAEVTDVPDADVIAPEDQDIRLLQPLCVPSLGLFALRLSAFAGLITVYFRAVPSCWTPKSHACEPSRGLWELVTGRGSSLLRIVPLLICVDGRRFKLIGPRINR